MPIEWAIGMTFVDAVVLGVLAIGLVLGIIRGFLSQFTGIAGLLGGLWLATRHHESLQRSLLDPNIETDHNGVIAFIGIVVVTVLAAGVVGWGVNKVFEKLELGAYDRLMGGALGAAKAGVICAAILLAVVYFAPNDGRIERAIGTSRVGPALWKGMHGLTGVLPVRYRMDVKEFLDSHRLPSAAVPEEDGEASAERE